MLTEKKLVKKYFLLGWIDLGYPHYRKQRFFVVILPLHSGFKV